MNIHWLALGFFLSSPSTLAYESSSNSSSKKVGKRKQIKEIKVKECKRAADRGQGLAETEINAARVCLCVVCATLID
jgi:hypothetical protein